MNFNFAIHAQRRFVVGRREPRGISLGSNRLEHVTKVLSDGYLFVGFRFRRDLKDIREHITFGIVVDDLDAALLIVVQRTEYSPILAHTMPPGGNGDLRRTIYQPHSPNQARKEHKKHKR